MGMTKLEKLYKGMCIVLSVLALQVRCMEKKDGVVGAGTWCVARSDASSAELQAALDWACGQESGQGNVNCNPILLGGVCDTPDTLVAHASYAFNAYFQNLNQAAGACDFNGCAQTTSSDPSLGACTYPSTATGSGFLSTSNVSSSTSPSNGGSIPNISLWSSLLCILNVALCFVVPLMLKL